MATIESIALAASRYEALELRSLVQELLEENDTLTEIAPPKVDDPVVMAIAASVLELLAIRLGQSPPRWTDQVPAVSHPVFLLKSVNRMPRLKALCEAESPLPLRKRRLYAPPDFLTFV